MARDPLIRSEWTAFAVASDAKEAMCRKLAADTRLSIYTTFANRHQTKAAKKRFLAARAPLVVASSSVDASVDTLDAPVDTKDLK